MKKAMEKASQLEMNLKLTEEEDRISKGRNADIKRRLNAMESCIREANLSDEKLNFLKRNCKNHLTQEHPSWEQYKEVLESQLLDALLKVKGNSERFVGKMIQPEYNSEANIIGQLTSSNLTEKDPSPRLQFSSQGIYQDQYIVPPEKPQRSLPRVYNEQMKNTTVPKVFSPNLLHENGNLFILQDQQQTQNGIQHFRHVPQQMEIGRFPSTIMPVGYPPQESILMQIPVGHNQEMLRVHPEERLYSVQNNIQPFYQQFQTSQQPLIEGGGTPAAVPKSYAIAVFSEEPQVIKTDQKQETTLPGANDKKATDIVSLQRPQEDQDEISEEPNDFQKEDEIQEVHQEEKKIQIPPADMTGNVENSVDYKTPRKENLLENFHPFRTSYSPEATPSRRLVKPVFSDIELTGNFESQIVYGKTPPVKSLSKLDPEIKSINDSQPRPLSRGIKKGSIEAATNAAATTEDTDFGIMSLPDNLLPVTGTTKASISESGQRKTGDMTTTDGLDTGVSNSTPGICLSHSSSNPNERSYISDYEAEDNPPLEPIFDVGMPSANHRQSKKNLRRSSSPVTPALSIKGLLLLMKMVENSFQTASCSKDEYYRSFQPSDEERGRIICESNNEGALTIDADPALVSMIILEQMTVIIRSLSTGCLLSDSLLQSEKRMTLSESDIKSQLSVDSVNLWENLFVHFSCLLKHKIMSCKEIAALFVPCLLQSGSVYQEKAFKLLVQLLEKRNRNLLSSPMGMTALSDISSDDLPPPAIPSPKTQQQTMKDKQELVSSIERAFSDEMDDDDDDDRIDEMDRQKTNKLNISHTPAYKNMLFGFMGSISVEEDGNSDSESDELEKEFGTTIPDTRQNKGKQPSTSGILTGNVPSASSAVVASTEDEDSRDYDFYD